MRRFPLPHNRTVSSSLAGLAAGLVLSTASAPAARSLHFAASGDDTRTSTQAQDPATPWKSLSKLSGTILAPGDSVLLHRGDVWHEGLVIGQSGNEAAPIVVTGYGEGSEPPKLDGSLRLAGTLEGGIREAKIPLGQEVASVRDTTGGWLPVSRFPTTGYLTSGGAEDRQVVLVPDLSAHDWAGASIHLRTAMWTLETHRIASQDGARATLSEATIYTPPDSVRYFVSNHAAALGSEPSWAWSASDSTLRWTGSAEAVDAAVTPVLVDLAGRDHVRIQGLQLTGSTQAAIRVSGRGVQVADCGIQDPGLMGIEASGRDFLASGNRIEGATNDAIVASGAGLRIEGNTIRDIATPRRLGPAGMGDGCCGGYGILVHGDSASLTGNDIDSTGYNGLGFFDRDNSVEDNLVAHSCMTTDDCAGIYTITGEYANTGASGGRVRRNVVRDAVGAPEGWKGAWPASYGIYLDDGSHDIEVDSNTVSNAVVGLFLHNTRRVVARGNTLYGNRSSPGLMTHDGLAGAGDMVGNRFEDNLLVGLPGQGASISSQISQAQDIRPSSSVGNTICSEQAVASGCRRDGIQLWFRERVAGDDLRLGPETQRNATFDTTTWGWDAYPSQVHLAQDSGERCFAGRCLRVSSAGPSADIYPMVYCGYTFSASAGQALRISFRARGAESGQKLTTTLRRSGNDWAILGFSTDVDLDTAWSRHVFLVRAPSEEAALRVEFHNSAIDSVYWLDEVSVRTVPDSLVPDMPLPELLVNTGSAPATLPLPAEGAWMDAWGGTLGSSVLLRPVASLVAFPTEAGNGIAPTPIVRGELVARRRGGMWVFEGLTEEAAVFDLRGRRVGRITPDSRGSASWIGPPGADLLWLRAGTTALPLFAP